VTATVLTPTVSSVLVTPVISSVVAIEQGAASVTIVDAVTVVNVSTVESTVVVTSDVNASVEVTSVINSVATATPVALTVISTAQQDVVDQAQSMVDNLSSYTELQGDLSSLTTEAKDNLVNSINEVNEGLANAGVAIDDSSEETSTVDVWSANKITSVIQEATDALSDSTYVDQQLDLKLNITAANTALDLKADVEDVNDAFTALIDSAPTELNTLAKLATSLNDDPDFAGTTNDALDLKDNITDVDDKIVTVSADAINIQMQDIARSIQHRQSILRTQSNLVNVIDSALNVDNRGPTGPEGPQGEIGLTGAAGQDGIYGAHGTDGLNGTNGSNGTNGTNGSDGYIPVKGVDYFDGNAGIAGYNGTDGSDGTNGADGAAAISGTSERYIFIATEGQLTFYMTYDVGYVDVFLNGFKLQSGEDFTAANGVTMVLTLAASLNDVVDVITYGAFFVADTYTQTSADNKFTQKANNLSDVSDMAAARDNLGISEYLEDIEIYAFIGL
jgi:hypothetical protein